jgi:hypothetical protein
MNPRLSTCKSDTCTCASPKDFHELTWWSQSTIIIGWDHMFDDNVTFANHYMIYKQADDFLL